MPINVETNERDQTSENILGKQTEELNEVSQSPAINLNDHKYLVELIRENSWFCCDSYSKKSFSRLSYR